MLSGDRWLWATFHSPFWRRCTQELRPLTRIGAPFAFVIVPIKYAVAIAVSLWM